MDYNNDFNDDFNDGYDNNNYEQKNGNDENKFVTILKENRKIIIILLVVIGFIILLSLLTKNVDNNIPGNEVLPVVKIQPYSKELAVGNSLTLRGSVENVPYSNIVYDSINESICSVNNNGTVVGISNGECVINASFYDNNGKKYSEVIRINIIGSSSANITSLGFPDGELVISFGSSYKLPIEIMPETASVSDISFTSSDNSVCRVDNNGVLSAAGLGTCKISLNYKNGVFTDNLDVFVVNEYVIPEIVQSPVLISFTSSSTDIKVGESKTLYFDYQPSTANTISLIWTSSNDSVCSVRNGVVTGNSVGSCNISVRTTKGVSSSISVNVVSDKVSVESLQIQGGSLISLEYGSTTQIKVMIYPTNATGGMLYYSSENPQICSVDQMGNVYGIKAGYCVVKVMEIESSKSVYANIQVTNPSVGSDDSGGYNPGTPSTPSTPSNPTQPSTGNTQNGGTLNYIGGNNTQECIANCVEISTNKGATPYQSTAESNPKSGNTNTILRIKDNKNIDYFQYCIYDPNLVSDCTYDKQYTSSVSFTLFEYTTSKTYAIKYSAHYTNNTYDTRIRYLTLKGSSSGLVDGGSGGNIYTGYAVSAQAASGNSLISLSTSYTGPGSTEYSNVSILLTKQASTQTIKYCYKAVGSKNTTCSMTTVLDDKGLIQPSVSIDADHPVLLIMYQGCDITGNSCGTTYKGYVRLSQSQDPNKPISGGNNPGINVTVNGDLTLTGKPNYYLPTSYSAAILAANTYKTGTAITFNLAGDATKYKFCVGSAVSANSTCTIPSAASTVKNYTFNNEGTYVIMAQGCTSSGVCTATSKHFIKITNSSNGGTSSSCTGNCLDSSITVKGVFINNNNFTSLPTTYVNANSLQKMKSAQVTYKTNNADYVDVCFSKITSYSSTCSGTHKQVKNGESIYYLNSSLSGIYILTYRGCNKSESSCTGKINTVYMTF